MRAGAAGILGLALLAACGGGDDGVEVHSATPPHGPVAGSTRITLRGQGFVALGAGSNRVMFGEHEAPLVATIDDDELDVVVPAGDRPGPVELTVISGDRIGRAAGLFHYSAPPTITRITPPDVLYRGPGTRMTVVGTGFVAEDAGDVEVTVGGQPAGDVEVLGDTLLTFTAPSGNPLARPDVEVVNRRGHGRLRRGFRFVPSSRRGLLLFARFSPDSFAFYVDPPQGSIVTIPAVAGGTAYRTVVLDDRGEYWAMEFENWGRLDTTSQRLEGALSTGMHLPAMTRVGPDYFAFDRDLRRFGRFDPVTRQFIPIGDDVPLTCCGSFGLASDGTRLYLAVRKSAGVDLMTVDPTTGVLGPRVPLDVSSTFRLEEMRFLDGVLYATTRDRSLVAIDPGTGTVTVIFPDLGRFTAMEVFEPRD